MLELRNISKTYGQTQALRSINLSVPAGKTTVFLGPSGCGKSTLIRIMNGLVQADAGAAVYFEGVQVSEENALQLRHKMGYVIQEGGLFPHLTTRQNIALMAEHAGWPKERIKERLTELIRLTQFPEQGLDRFPAELSGGQRQRVSLMRALMLDPDLLLLDEPLGALDPMIRSELQSELRQIFQTLGKTVVLVTHDIGEADFLGDFLVLLRDGQIVQQGLLGDMVRNPAEPFVSQFINAQRSPDVLRQEEES
jgi:osmoprotectant transport system ATP-binding protein